MPRVLIVEDTETCAATLEIALASLPGVAVEVVGCGREAWRLLESDAADPVCALITDLNMPRMDGFELIERIRSDGRHRSLPVIVVSGDTTQGVQERLGRLGVEAFFPKPYSPAAVRDKLERLLNAHLPEKVP
ncbi:MAG: response regulator [Bryobacterales bacterium]|nr:response regulator [Bryobacterales bacterium]